MIARSPKKWLRHLVEQVFLTLWSFYLDIYKMASQKHRINTCAEIELNSAALLIQALFHSCDYSPVTSVIIRLTEYSSIKITKEKKTS